MYGDEERLNNLFAAYRETLPDPDPGPGFMPGLWSKIESRRRYTKLLRRATGAFVTAAAALSLMMALYVARPDESLADSTTYVDTLDQEDLYHTVARFETPNFRNRPVGMPQDDR